MDYLIFETEKVDRLICPQNNQEKENTKGERRKHRTYSHGHHSVGENSYI